MAGTVIRVENLGKRYLLGRNGAPKLSGYQRTLRDALSEGAQNLIRRNGGRTEEEFWALRDISFGIEQGQVVGIIGRNGAGKSTLLKVLSRITEPTTGKVRIQGRIASLLEVGTGFHPELTGRENVFLNGAILGMSRAEIRDKFDEIVAFAEVEKFLDTPVKRYSSGMYVRLAFAVAAHLEPEILIIDEVLAVGDSDFQKKCLGKMEDVSRGGRTVIFVSHNMQAVRQLCTSVMMLDKGQLAFTGIPSDAVLKYFGGDAEASGTVDLSAVERPRMPLTARLLAVRFSSDSVPAAEVRRTSQLEVTLAFTVSVELAAFDVAMAILHADGARVFSESLSDQHGRSALAPGDYAVTFALDAKHLKLEPYFLTVYLLDSDTALDFVEGIALPEVVDPAADAFRESRRWGTVRIPVAWSAVSAASR